MSGPAQRDLTYGLQAARESTHSTAPLLVVRLLADLAQHQRWTGNYDTAVRLHDIALSRLPVGGNEHNLTRAYVLSGRALALSHLGPASRSEVDSVTKLASELNHQATDAEPEVTSRLAHRRIDLSVTELNARAACGYLALAAWDRRFADVADAHNRFTLANPSTGQGRNQVHAQIRLARLRFLSGEPEQGCVEGQQAI